MWHSKTRTCDIQKQMLRISGKLQYLRTGGMPLVLNNLQSRVRSLRWVCVVLVGSTSSTYITSPLLCGHKAHDIVLVGSTSSTYITSPLLCGHKAYDNGRRVAGCFVLFLAMEFWFCVTFQPTTAVEAFSRTITLWPVCPLTRWGVLLVRERLHEKNQAKEKC